MTELYREVDPDGELAAWVAPLARYLYVADLIPDRVVLDLGCGTGVGCEFLANHGAKRIVGVDLDRGAIAAARSRRAMVNVDYRAQDYTALELDDESVDVIFAHGAELLRQDAIGLELRRVLREDGYLIWAAPSADRSHARRGVSYYEFVDRLGARFGEPRMVAIQPFVAMSLVEYADEEPPVELDTSLARLDDEAGEVTEYLAVFGPGAAANRPFTIVQLPAAFGLDAALNALGRSPDDTGALRRELDTDRRELHALRGRLAELEALAAAAADGATAVMSDEASGAAASVAVTPSVASEAAPEGRAGAERLVAEALEEHARRVEELELAVRDAREYAGELEDEIAAGDDRLRDLRNQLAAEGARADTLSKQLGTWRDRASRAEGEALRVKLAAASAPCPPESQDEEAARSEIRQVPADVELVLEHDAAAEAAQIEPAPAVGELEREVAVRDAEITLLTVGLRSLEQRLGSLADELEDAAARGDQAVVRDLIAQLRGYAGGR